MRFYFDIVHDWGGPCSVTASTTDCHAGGLGFKSQCRPTNFRPVWSPSIPIPRLKSKNGKGFPEEGEVGAEGLWFRRAPREAKKKSCSTRFACRSRNRFCTYVTSSLSQEPQPGRHSRRRGARRRRLRLQAAAWLWLRRAAPDAPYVAARRGSSGAPEVAPQVDVRRRRRGQLLKDGRWRSGEGGGRGTSRPQLRRPREGRQPDGSEEEEAQRGNLEEGGDLRSSIFSGIMGKLSEKSPRFIPSFRKFCAFSHGCVLPTVVTIALELQKAI